MAANKPPEASTGGRRPATRRPSPAVYRRRRLVVGVLALLVLGLLTAGGIGLVSLFRAPADAASGQAGSGPTGTGPAASASAAPESPAPTAPAATGQDQPSPSVTGTTAAGQTCDSAQITVQAATDAASYPAGKNPVLTLKITNGGSSACSLNVGTSQMEFTVTSGADRIFSSADCQADSQDLVKSIGAGKTEIANFIWKRNRTAPGCAAVGSKPLPGTYGLQTRLGELKSDRAVFQLE